MIKQQKGFNPTTRDWEFFAIDVSKDGSKIYQRGFENVNNRFGLNCFACHQQARKEFDLVCELDHGCAPIPITRPMIRALQKTDPRCANPQPQEDKQASRSRKGIGTERGARKKAVTQFSSCPVNRNALKWYRWTILLLSVATRGNGALVAPGSVRAAGDLRKWLTCYRLRTIYALWQVRPDWELEIGRIGRSLWFT
jgi:hypothetical protein